MLRRRVEKLEVHLPMSSARLLERLDRRALNQLSGSDRGLVKQMLAVSGRRKNWSPEFRAAESRYLDNFGILLREISDQELTSLIAQIEGELGHSIHNLEATA